MGNKLQDICLCAIVKNEEINAAGGIRDYVESIVPYVGAAVIIDTGSTDGTREILEKCSIKYPNLKIFDREFRGFDDARNYSVQKGKLSKKKYALFLDGKERLVKPDFERLEYMMNKNESGVYSFDFCQISFETGEKDYSPTWNNRLISFVNNPIFKGKVYELPSVDDNQKIPLGIYIKRFLPSKDSRSQKLDWYNNMKSKDMSGDDCFEYIKGFEEWKKVSPYRDEILEKSTRGNGDPFSDEF
jgi:glycosyltransferase involved in cell wall biosynthesis